MTDSTFVRAEIDFASGDDKVAEGADDFMGQQLEFRWRYQALPDLRLEFGGAYLHKGGDWKPAIIPMIPSSPTPPFFTRSDHASA